jgi:hypothetical protein
MSLDNFLPQYAAQAVADIEEIVVAVDKAAKRAGQDRVEAFLRTDDNAALYQEAKFLAATIRSAVHVVLPKNAEIYRSNFPIPPPTAEEIESLVGLPAPTTCFEFYCDNVQPATKMIAIVIDRKQLGEGQTGLVVFQTFENPDKFIPTRNGIYFPMPLEFVLHSDHKLAVVCKPFRVSKERGPFKNEDSETQVAEACMRGLHAAIQCCHALRAGATLNEQWETSAGRRYKFEKKGVGGFTYHVLKLPEKYADSLPGHGEHASPRFHVRRAHIRKLPTGVLTFVRQCFVGDRERGIVAKHYKVEAQSDAKAVTP